MEYISSFFLVFAGLIFGFVLWYRDRSSEEKQRRKLAKDNDDLRLSLKIAHNSHSKLDERFNRQQGQLHVLQQLCDDWSQSREQTERERAEIEAVAASNVARLDETRGELDSEKQRRVALEDQLHQATQAHLEKVAQVEESYRKQIAKLESSGSQKDGKLATLETDNQQLKKQLEAAETSASELASDLKSQQQLLETATKNHDGLSQEYTSLETALQSRADELKGITSEKAKAVSACKVAEESLASLRAEHDKLRSDNDKLTERVADYDSLHAQVNTVQQALGNSASQLKLVVGQRDSALDSDKAKSNVIVGLKKRLDNQENTIRGLRCKHDGVLEQLRKELEARAKLEATLDESITELEQIEESRIKSVEAHGNAIAQLTRQRDSFADKLAEVEGQLSSSSETQVAAIKQTTAQRDQLADELKLAQEEMVALVGNHQKKIDELVDEADKVQRRHAVARQESETLAQQCDELTLLCTELEQKLEVQASSTTSLEQTRRSLLEQLNSKTQKVSELENNCEALSNRCEALESRCEALQSKQSEFSNVKETFEANQVQLVNVEKNRLELTTQIDQLAEQRDALLTELADSRESYTNASKQLVGSQSQIEELQNKIEELEVKSQRIEELEALMKDRSLVDQRSIDEVRVLRQQYADTFADREALKQQLADIENSQDDREEAAKVEASQLASLQAKVVASEETIRTLRRERAAVLARLANYRTVAEPDATVISFTEAMAIRAKSDVDYDAEYGGPVRTHATRGVVYTEPPKQVDDLKRISGIAEVLEGRLNDYGIYTFKQIKEWSPEAIEEFSHLLSFRDRISRDDWVGQASQFYREKQSTPKTYAA